MVMGRGHILHICTPGHPKKSIKIEIAAIIAVTLIGLLIFILLLSNIIITAGFSNIETDIAEDNVNRATNALNADVERLDGIANAWASSEEIESFIQTGNSAIPRQVFSDGRLLDSGVNILVISEAGGNVLWHKFMNLDYAHQSPTPKSLLEQIETNAGLTENGQAKGMVMLTSGPMILASRPVYAGTDRGATGLLTVGRYLDTAEVASLSAITQLDISFATLNLTESGGGAVSAGMGRDGTGTIFIDASGSGELVGSTVLEDIYGEPVAMLSVRTPRDITEYGAGVLQYQVFSILFAGLVFGIVTLLLIQRSVVSRLEDLNRQVNRIGDGTGNTERVVIPGEDEIAYLGCAINDMLDSIEESREEYRRLFEEASDLILNLDADGRIIAANRKTERITGYDRSFLRGMPFCDLLAADTGEAVMQSLLTCSGRSGASLKEEVTIETREKRQRILELSVQAHSWGEDTGGLFIIARDVTRKKDAEEELRHHRNNLEEMVSRRTKELEQANEEIAAEKKKLSVTLRSITDGVITTDAAGAVVLMNPAATEMLGLSSADAYGTAVPELLDFTPEGSQRRVDDLISAVIREKRPVECSGDLRVGQNDTTIPVMLSVAPVAVAGTDVGGCVIVFRNISST